MGILLIIIHFIWYSATTIIVRVASQHVTKDSIASQRYATPRDFAVNSVTLRKWRHLIKSVLNYDNEGSNYRDCTSVLGHDNKGSKDSSCTSGHIYPPLTQTHPTCLVDSVFKLVYYFN